MTRTQGRPWLWMALAATLLASAVLALDPPQDEPLPVVAARVPATEPAARRMAADADPAAPWPARVARSPAPAWPRLASAALTSWGTSPPPPPPRALAPALPPTPAPPQAPPFPYQLIGRLEGADGQRALLTNEVRTQAVSVGTVVDGQWRIDQLDRTSMAVTWLPGEQARRVAYGISR